MGLKRLEAPANLAVSVAEAKTQIGLLTNSHDDFIGRLVFAAIEAAERYTGRALVNQTWRLSLGTWPCDAIRLPRPPLQSVTSIVYVDDNGDEQELDSDLYHATSDIEPARIEPAYGEAWPSARCEREAVRVTYVAGYGSDSTSVPEGIRHAILLMVAHWFAVRESVGSESLAEVPMSCRWLLDSYRTGAGAEYYGLVE